MKTFDALDAGTLVNPDDQAIGQHSGELVKNLLSQSWIAAALALVMLVLALLKKFGVFPKKAAPPPEPAKPDADADAAADQARSQLSMGDKEE